MEPGTDASFESTMDGGGRKLRRSAAYGEARLLARCLATEKVTFSQIALMSDLWRRLGRGAQ